MVFDSDDFGCNHIISDQTQSHDCRDVLDKLHYANPSFKATLFAIPGEMTSELLEWCKANHEWIQLAWHGFYHRTNYECAEMSYEEFDNLMNPFIQIMGDYFNAGGFKAPGWQISDGVYEWLKGHNLWVADQPYNNDRRPKDLPVYLIGDGSVHTHTWNCVGNGVYELYDDLEAKVKSAKEFKFISEVI